MPSQSKQVVLSAAFDDLRSRHIRLLQEAALHGPVTVWLWPDAMVQERTGRPPKFGQDERLYLVRSIRHVADAQLLQSLAEPGTLPAQAPLGSAVWAVDPDSDSPSQRAQCTRHGWEYLVLRGERSVPLQEPTEWASASPTGRKKVVVTGCYDWLHSGHVRFFEEVSAYGDLYVILGRDENIRLLKGEGHPLVGQDERRYVVGAIRFVKAALFGTGRGWLDAEPEIGHLRPDIYAVNEDGDKGGKREFCAQRGIQYLVLKREPATGLPRRTSTDLRGF
ncbi:MAG: adenylyltransferase/cytidyltransferase family protein [Verrucomicrobiota bacterium]